MMLNDLKQDFLHPSKEFSPFPFWFWNDELSEEELERQMRAFKAKGVDGFVIHPRLGLPESIGYLTETYFHYVRFAVQKARELDMKVILYDEGMYPSGSCHGNVVKENPNFASRGLVRREKAESNPNETLVAQAERDGKTYYYYECFSGGTIRGIHFGEDDGEPGAPASADLLNPQAVACFIRLTHDVYAQHLGEYFGSTVTAFFTDEPNILGRCAPQGMIPWTTGFLDDFKRQGGREEDLYDLFSETANPVREKYERAVYERLSKAYYKQISDWCSAHHLALTGHPEKSTDIGYLQYFGIPCQDIVWRYVAPEDGKALCGEHSTMGKCSSDSARHRGKRRNGNECFGCCGALDDPYRFTEEDMKWYLDWLFVRGVNMIYPHAFYYSLRGKRKEERPPEVGMHSGFWEDYRRITDYIKRMCSLLTDSVNQAQVAVLCGTRNLSWKMAKPLFEHQIEFNYLEEKLLPDCSVKDGKLCLQNQAYSLVVADHTVSGVVQEILHVFQKQGGHFLDWRPGMGAGEVEAWIARPYVFEPAARDLRCTYLKKDGVPVMILVNEGEAEINTVLHLRRERVAEVWDAWTGTMQSVSEPSRDWPLRLKRRESRILVLQCE